MLYYKVRKEADQKPKNPRIMDCNIFVKNELYTKKELEKIKNKYGWSDRLYNFFDVLEISKNKTYFFFGCRFCDMEA